MPDTLGIGQELNPDYVAAGPDKSLFDWTISVILAKAGIQGRDEEAGRHTPFAEGERGRNAKRARNTRTDIRQDPHCWRRYWFNGE